MMILLTGGAACGKSAFAEKLCENANGVKYYIATMQPYGDEGRMRISRHRAMRDGKGFVTVERYTDIGKLSLPERGTALLECIANLTANEMFRADGTFSDPVQRVVSGVEELMRKCDMLVVVTNDVGSDGLVYDEATNEYIRAIGCINAKLAVLADTVAELVAGLPVVVKGELPV